MGVAVGEQSAGTAPPHQTGDPVPSRPRVTAHPLTQTRYDQELHALVRHVYGYSWTCSAHGRGPTFDTMAGARHSLREHEAEHAGLG